MTDRRTIHGNGISVEPYRVEMDCMRYSKKTGRATMRILIQNVTTRPLRFRGDVSITIRHDLAMTPDGHKRWRPYATARTRTPLLTVAPRTGYEWSRRSPPILLHGSTKGLSLGSCAFSADPPRTPS
ncbi:MAG TPA: hypothetical protein VHS27_07965 [Gaiellales bacterium]|nr:hypothetical protein [Gaiellales bacterium]